MTPDMPAIDERGLKSCPFCGSNEHLSIVKFGSLTGDMPARPYRVVCSQIDHDDVCGPVGYGRPDAIAAWNRRASPKASQEAEVAAWQRFNETIGRWLDTQAEDVARYRVLGIKVRALVVATPQPDGDAA